MRIIASLVVFVVFVVTLAGACGPPASEACASLVEAMCARAESEGCFAEDTTVEDCEIDVQGQMFPRGCASADRVSGDVDGCARAVEEMSCPDFETNTFPRACAAVVFIDDG